MDPTYQWVIPLLMSLYQTKNGFVLSLFNQTEIKEKKGVENLPKTPLSIGEVGKHGKILASQKREEEQNCNGYTGSYLEL